MAETLNYVSSEAVEEAQEDAKRRLGQAAPVLPGILGAFGLACATIAVVTVARKRSEHERHPAVAELMASAHRWERDIRHHRGALQQLERALQHERRELEHHRRHALIGLMHR